MLRTLWTSDRALHVLWLSAAASVGVWLIFVWLGFNEPVGGKDGPYQTYFQMHNWWTYPFLFLTLAPGLWLTWEPLLGVWRNLADTRVLKMGEDRPGNAALANVHKALQSKRYIAVIVALVVATAINIADRERYLDLYSGVSSFPEQVEYACDEPSPFLKWILVEQVKTGSLCQQTTNADTNEEGLDMRAVDGIPAPAGQIFFFAVTALQQLMIVFLAVLAVAQLLLHTALFTCFERLAVARKHGLGLHLNFASPLSEFGLEHWNHVLNNFYWAVSPALLGVFLSRASTPAEKYLPGQSLLGIAIPAAVLVPMIVTILVRQARLPAAWAIMSPEDSDQAESYRRQQLWPLDRNWSSKLGIVLAFVLASLSIGLETRKLLFF